MHQRSLDISFLQLQVGGKSKQKTLLNILYLNILYIEASKAGVDAFNGHPTSVTRWLDYFATYNSSNLPQIDKNCQSRFKILPNKKLALKTLPKLFERLQKCLNFAKSGHTASFPSRIEAQPRQQNLHRKQVHYLMSLHLLLLLDGKHFKQASGYCIMESTNYFIGNFCLFHQLTEINMLMTGFELRTSGVGSDCSDN